MINKLRKRMSEIGNGDEFCLGDLEAVLELIAENERLTRELSRGTGRRNQLNFNTQHRERHPGRNETMKKKIAHPYVSNMASRDPCCAVCNRESYEHETDVERLTREKIERLAVENERLREALAGACRLLVKVTRGDRVTYQPDQIDEWRKLVAATGAPPYVTSDDDTPSNG